MGIGIISSLIPLIVFGAIVYSIVKAVSGRREPGGADAAPGSVRRVFVFGALYGVLHLAAWGLAGLIAELSRRDGQIAEPLALTIVSVPVALLLGRWAWRLIQNPAERGFALAAYVGITLSTALIAMMATAFRVATGLLTNTEFSWFALAALAVWSGVWAAHWLVWKKYQSDIPNTHLYLGSAAGLWTAAVSAIVLLTYLFRWLLDTGTALGLTSYRSDDIARPAIALVIGAVVLGWYWFANGIRARRDPVWHGYVVLVGVLGGLITAVAGAAVSGYAVLEWWFGDPGSASAVRHFDDFLPAVAVLAGGAAVWAYHRFVVLRETPPERTEVNRVYDYVVGAVGLVTATVGATLLLIGLQEALFPPADGGRVESSINILLGAGTALAVGGPLWWQAWRRANRYARTEPAREVSSPTRRTYLFGVLGVAGIVGFGSALTLLVALFNAMFDEGGGQLRDDIQVPLAMLLAVGGIAIYHWTVARAERDKVEPPVPTKDITLVTGDMSLASVVSDLTGARVRVMHRLDANGDLLDPAAVARAVAADDHQHLLVLTGPHGAVEVIPYET